MCVCAACVDVTIVDSIYISDYHYTNLTFVRDVRDVRDVRESGRSREAIRPELKRFLSLHQWTWSRHEVVH